MKHQTTVNVTDAKIIKTLQMESRASYTELAKECKLSVTAVRNRYEKLRKAGIVNGEIMQVNPTSLGYKCVANVAIITAKEDEDKVVEFLRRKPYSRVVFKNLFEKVNIATIIGLREFEQLPETLRDIEANPLIKHANASVWSKTSGLDHPENLMLIPSVYENGEKQHSKPDTIKLKEAKIDETDIQIAKILSQNSRTPFSTIAGKLNISIKTVIQRYNKLRGTVLSSSTVTVNMNKLGFKAMAHLMIKAKNKSKTPEITKELLQIPNLITVLEFFGGEFDLMSIIVLRDYEELFKLKEQISMIQGIEQSDIVVSKPYYAWPLNLFASLL